MLRTVVHKISMKFQSESQIHFENTDLRVIFVKLIWIVLWIHAKFVAYQSFYSVQYPEDYKPTKLHRTYSQETVVKTRIYYYPLISEILVEFSK